MSSNPQSQKLRKAIFRETNIKKRSIKLPLLVGLIGIIATLSVWYFLKQNEDVAIYRMVNDKAAGIKDSIEIQTENHVHGLERMASRWSIRGNTPRQEWESDSQRYVRDFDAYQAVEWVDETGHIRWIMPEAGNEKAINFDLTQETNRRTALEKSRDERLTTLSRSIDLVQGGKGFLVFAPIYTNDKFGGFITGIFRMNKFVESSLPPQTLENYSIEIFDNENSVYQSSPIDNAGIEYTSRKSLNNYGVSWTLQVRPTSQNLASLRSFVDEGALAIGLLLSGLAAWITWLVGQTRRGVWQTEEANKGMQKEITERERIRKILQETSTLQKAVLNGANYMIIATDPEGTIISFNKAAEKNLGYAAEELIGISTPAVFHDLHQIIERAEELSAETGQKFEPGFEVFIYKSRINQVYEREWTYVRKDGSHFPVSLSITALRNEIGEITGFLGIANDITERLRFENELQKEREFLEALLENVSDGIVACDSDGRLTIFNRRMREMHGLPAKGELEPEKWAEYYDLYEADGKTILNLEDLPLIRAFNGEQISSFEMVISPKNGSSHYVIVNGQPIFDKDSKKIGAFIVIHDLTKQKQAAQEILNVQERFKAFMNHSPTVSNLKDENGRYVFINRTMENMFDVLFEDLEGKTDFDWMPENAARTMREKEDFVIKSGESMQFTQVFPTSDGQIRTWQIYKFPVLDGSERKLVGGIGFDVTENKCAEIAVRESEERLRLFVEHTPAAVAMLDKEMRYVMASQRWLADYNLGNQDVIGRSHYEVFPDIPQRWKDIHQRGIKGEILKCDEDPFPREDGTMEWLRWEMRPWHDNKGEIGGIIFFTEVITERKRIEAEIAHSAAIIESSNDAIISKTFDGIIKTWNRGAEKIFGYTADEMIGKHISILFPPELVDEESNFIKQIKYGNQIKHYETVRIRKDGLNFPISLTLSPIVDEKGNIIGISKIARDITLQKESEQALKKNEDRFRNQLHHSPVGIVLTDTKGGLIFANDRWNKMTGLKMEESLGAGWVNAIHPDDRERVVKEWQKKSIAAEETTYEFRFISKTGEVGEVLARALKRYDENGVFQGHFATIADITEIKHLQADLKIARDAALESARLKSEFLANMSHEIRTPMNGVIGMTDVLLSGDLDSEQREYAEIIKSSADGLLNIINDILDFSKIEAGKLSFEVIDFDLLNTVENVVGLFAEQSQNKKLELASLVESDINPDLCGDPGRLRQILTNLIGNAVKFTEKGEIIVHVLKESETETNCTLRFNITDTGIGIKPENKRYLFQAFTQADGSMTRKYGGTGLGLAISRQLVEMMDGEITVESEIGKGSVFSFTAKFKKQLANPEKKIAPLKDLKNLRVLVVDDNSTNRKILKHQLSSWGMIVEQAESGMEGLIKLREAVQASQPFDIVVLDLMMPGMNGFEMAYFIKSDIQISNIKLILMPSFGHREHAKKARENGIDGYLIKPVRQSDLFDCIATTMAKEKNAAEAQVENELCEHLSTGYLLNDNKNINNQLILIAEDNVVNQKVAKMQLERLGYRAEIVANGLEALEAVKLKEYAAILMDCQMPQMDGYKATSKIREIQKGIRFTPIIAMTANAMQGEREKCLAEGMDDYIAKPVQIDTLSQTLQRWISKTEINRNAPPQKNNYVELDNVETLDHSVIEGFREFQSPDSPDLLTDLINLFLEDAGNRMKILKQAIGENDKKIIKEQVHTFKGSAGNIGARRMAFLSKKIEGNLDNKSQIEYLYVELEKEFAKVKEQLGSLQKAQ